MKNYELDYVLKDLNSGTITVKQAVNRICTFISKNYPVFGLHRYDEDFRSEIILAFLERGEHILSLYNPEAGNFFTFIYCYLNTLASSKRKVHAKSSVSEIVVMEELKKTVEEKALKYTGINYSHIDMPKAPYAYKPVPAEELKNALQELASCNADKKILVLALKSSFYLPDSQIDRICKLYKINKEHFYELIQVCKNSIQKKSDKRWKIQERRNSAYYHHQRYKTIINKLSQDDISHENDILISRISRKQQKCKKQWSKLNHSFEKGLMKLRPTNRTVANLLGICERQVSYYINCAKKEVEKKQETKDSDSN